jgi:hypothetical protein
MMPLSIDTKHMQNNMAGIMIKKTLYTSETWQLIIWYSAEQKFKMHAHKASKETSGLSSIVTKQILESKKETKYRSCQQL